MDIFGSTAIPVLEQVVAFTQARHGVLAGNVANLDTPDYKTRDLSPALFQEKLKEAIEDRDRSHSVMSPALPTHQAFSGSPTTATGLSLGTSLSVPSEMNPGSQSLGFTEQRAFTSTDRRSVENLRDVADSMKSILYHDESDVAIEKQVTEIAKNQSRHNLALSLMISQFQLIEAAVTERA